MKPNISSDWLKELRQRLKSTSTKENSIERNHPHSARVARAMATI